MRILFFAVFQLFGPLIFQVFKSKYPLMSFCDIINEFLRECMKYLLHFHDILQTVDINMILNFAIRIPFGVYYGSLH